MYNDKMAQLGYTQLVCDIFIDWENVKDEILVPDRKTGSGNGTIHVFLGAADTELRKEFPSYYESVESGKDTSIGTIEVKHYFMISNIISMLGYVCDYMRKRNEDVKSFISNTLDYINTADDEAGLLSTKSLFKLSVGSNKLRPYFKQFESDGVFSKLVRQILLPNSSYKISLYKNDEGEYAAFWLIGFDWQSSFDADSSTRNLNRPKKKANIRFNNQQIFYGAPGTGKSHTIEEKTNGKSKIRTTFHPDSDYSTFVGCYKPYKANGNAPITYEFVPQAFVKAYVEAWKKYNEPISSEVYLVIEEINRGNCAQIFGDLFQLLDRDVNGFSKYMIDADYDLQRYLQKEFYGDTFDEQFADIKSGEKLCLPNNLHIWATMNTSDQSLFPMDSAFKRRWEWEYVPVNHEDAKRFHIFIGGKSYNWDDFIVAVNKKVFDATQSADKQLGNRFCKSDGLINSGESDEKKQEYMIFSNQFVSKVMFYLWEEVCKDAPEDEQINFMRIKKNLSSTTSEYFTFQELYENKPYNGFILNKEAILQMFMNYLGVAEESSANFKSILAGKSIVDIEKTATGIRPNECNLSDLLGEKTTSDSEMTSVEEDVDATSENNDE